VLNLLAGFGGGMSASFALIEWAEHVAHPARLTPSDRLHPFQPL